MTAGRKVNLAASVAARLLNKARETDADHQSLLTNYCLERFLYRLGASACRDRFVLKGAMLLRLWSEQPYRATRDLDLLRRGDGAFDAIREDLLVIVGAPVTPDGVVFDADGIVLEAIRAEDEYAGARATLPARCANARLRLQIDMGHGDAIWPAPLPCAYPSELDGMARQVETFPVAGSRPIPSSDPAVDSFSATIATGCRSSSVRADQKYTIYTISVCIRGCPSARKAASIRPAATSGPRRSICRTSLLSG